MAWCLRESALAAASAGALTWLLDAGVAPYAVCGMQAARMACGTLSGRLRRGRDRAARRFRRRPRGAAAAHGGCLRPRRLGMVKARSAGEGG
ncbi:MAG: hypothetical protein ACLUHE_04555 [Christensenellales bacterium]